MDFNKKLTKNFKWGEFWSGSKRGVKIEPDSKYYESILKVAEQLQIVRSILNKKIIVRSGYRTPEWNKFIGGAINSYHMKGMAADTRAIGINIVKYAMYLLRYTNFNGYGIYKDGGIVHSDLRENFIIFRY